MDVGYLTWFLDITGFPEEARTAVLQNARRLQSAGADRLEDAVKAFYESGARMEAAAPEIEGMGEQAGLSPYEVWLLFLIEASQRAREDFRKDGVSEEVFRDTFADLKYKALECKEVHGVWGNFVSFWYPIFYTRKVVKLGRLEYERGFYGEEEPFSAFGLVLTKETPVYHIHIPSSGEPFDLASRMKSYQTAYEFFREELSGRPLVCRCWSWLLYPDYGRIYAPGSNVSDFQRDFMLLKREETETFEDAWRVFGKDAGKPLPELPERTSMQRALKNCLLSGKKPGEGMGVLIYDGERLLTRS